MSKIHFDAEALKKAFLSAASALDANKAWINELNVFPVPDGDTGTNMTLTIMSAANEVAKMENPTVQELCKVMSSGTLRGARGNSGVILSQLISGFAKVLSEEPEIHRQQVAKAFAKATDVAYKAVMKPKEGTILTVARAISDKALELLGEDMPMEEYMAKVLEAGDVALANTPNQLPVLKQAGVVDSGGQGLMVILHAAVESFAGHSTEFKASAGGNVSATASGMTNGSKGGAAGTDIDTADIKFGYCTEFIIDASFTDKDESEFKEFLVSMGDSIVCVPGDGFVKVHVHTNDPGKVISKAITYGELTNLKIDNMRQEHRELLFSDSENPDGPRSKYAFISVSAGEGLSEVFKGLGCDIVIEGGQTMNPSAEDIYKAIEKTHAETVFVLPNNKNIVMAANLAAKIEEDEHVVVIPTKSIPQGITALMNFNADADWEENNSMMLDAISAIKFCEVTHAVRDTSIDGFDIKEGNIMAIGEDGMLAVGTDVVETICKAVSEMVDDDSELITLYYGDEVSENEAEELADRLSAAYPDIDFDTCYGGQPVYYYFISVE